MRHDRDFNREIAKISCDGDGDGVKLGNLGEVSEKGALEKLLLRIVRWPDNNTDPVDGTQHDGGLDHILENDLRRGAASEKKEKKQEGNHRFSPPHFFLRVMVPEVL